MNARIAIESAAPMRAAGIPCLFTRKHHGKPYIPAGSGPSQHRLLSTKLIPAWQHRLTLVAAFLACLSFTSRQASAQEVIHASTGTVASVDAAGKSISIQLDDGSIRTFRELAASHAASSLAKTLQAKAIPAGGCGKVGEHVILFYYGLGDMATAVAYKDAGTAPPIQMSGVVSQFEKKQRLLTVVGGASQKKQLSLPEETVVDTPEGVIDGLQFHPSKGDHLDVLWSQDNGQPIALFISES